MKKKLISLLLVSAMAAATAGCGSSVPANSVNSRDDLPGKKIGVQLGTTGDSDATEYEKNDGSTVERYNKGADAIQALKTGKIDCVIIDQQPAEAFVEKNDDLKILSDTFDPYEYYDGDQIVGIDADIAKAICDKLGYELKIEDMEFDAIIAAVSSGKADFGAAGITVTEARKKNIDFTDTYTKACQVIVVRNK